MKLIGKILLAGLLCLTGCANAQPGAEPSETPQSYRQIDQETAKEMMAQEDAHLIVDVRRYDEYRNGHIPGAICVPNEEIGETPPEDLPKPDQILLIYCRSGNRSKQAAEKLAALGYTNLYEFGGIIDWTGEVVTGQSLALTVESNASTGFSWTAEQEGELFSIQDFYTALTQKQPTSGHGGWQTFLLTPRESGEGEVSFRYRRPWEEASEVDPQFSFRFAVSEDGLITVTEDGCEEGAAQGYRPTVRIYG